MPFRWLLQVGKTACPFCIYRVENTVNLYYNEQKEKCNPEFKFGNGKLVAWFGILCYLDIIQTKTQRSEDYDHG